MEVILHFYLCVYFLLNLIELRSIGFEDELYKKALPLSSKEVQCLFFYIMGKLLSQSFFYPQISNKSFAKPSGFWT